MIYCKKDSSLFIRYYFLLKKDIFLGSRTTFYWFFIRDTLYTETCQVLLMFRLDFDQVLVGIFDPFLRLWMLWHPKNLEMAKLWPTKRNLNFYSRFCEKKPFFGSGMTCEVLFVLLVSRVILLCLLKKQTRPNHRSFLTPKNGHFSQNQP